MARRQPKTEEQLRRQRERQRKYQLTEKGRRVRSEYRASDKFKSYTRTSKVKRQTVARVMVQAAINRGDMPHISERLCSGCGAQADHYHHHAGYDKKNYLKVTPLCTSCHSDTHSNGT